jgi:hypothetical protein
VLVRVQDHVATEIVERLPERPHRLRLAALRSALEPGVVPERQRARRRVGREIGGEPFLLRRAGITGYGVATVARVQRDQVPASDVEAVIALAANARDAVRLAHAVVVVEVAVAVGLGVFVVARDGMGEREQLGRTPGGCVVRLELAQVTVAVGLVAKRQDRGQSLPAREQLDQLGRSLLRASLA